MIHKKWINQMYRQSGAAMVEFAIVLIPLLIVMLGVIEISVILMEDNNLNKSVRDSARYLSDNWGVAGCSMNNGTFMIKTSEDNIANSTDATNRVSSTNILITPICLDSTGAITNDINILGITVNANSGDCSNIGTNGDANFCRSKTTPTIFYKPHLKVTATYQHTLIAGGFMGLNFTPNLSATSIFRVLPVAPAIN